MAWQYHGYFAKQAYIEIVCRHPWYCHAIRGHNSDWAVGFNGWYDRGMDEDRKQPSRDDALDRMMKWQWVLTLFALGVWGELARRQSDNGWRVD